MDDLTKRLRQYGHPASRGSDHPQSRACREAADRIEADAARLRELEAMVKAAIAQQAGKSDDWILEMMNRRGVNKKAMAAARAAGHREAANDFCALLARLKGESDAEDYAHRRDAFSRDLISRMFMGGNVASGRYTLTGEVIVEGDKVTLSDLALKGESE